MELVIKEIKPLICLNMIVKDESHIIVDTLTKLLSKMPIDYWVISDTGSTDNTQEIIKTFFKERGIPGELYEDKWENFAHNRTLALEHAHGKSEYIFVFDADDELCGDFQLPVLTEDAYHIQFGDANGTSYTRVLLVNNNTKKWRYLSVIHEFIDCVDNSHTSGVIAGNYYCVSGRLGNRSKDPDKYLKDALVLEKAHAEALAKNDLLYFRYAFYCANSYFDYGKYEDAIKWYKITLGQGNWEQEKYVSCMKLFICYNILKQPEAAMFYLVKGILYDKTRVEGLFELVQYYCGNDMNELAYMYYGMVKEFYEKEYVKIEHTLDKLFVDISKANFHLPYWMIIVADRIKKYDTGIAMYRIIFTKKFKETNKMLIGNMLFNLQFFIDKVDKNDTQFFTLFKEYVDFLLSLQYPVFDHDFMINYEKYGIVIPKKTIHRPIFTKEECVASNKILFYTGFNDKEWNYSYTKSNALGGAESAVAYLANNFPKNYHVYVTGSVSEETYDNVTYVNFNNLGKLIETNAFHTIIVSRYIGFYEMFPTFSAYQTYIWGHDIVLFPYGSSLSENEILSKWTNKITGCICQTEWHKNLFINNYPSLKEKLCVINNGINIDKFVGPIKAPSLTLQSLIHKTSANAYVFLQKVPNRFIYSSCSERGLQKLLDLWPQIIEHLLDAELYIATYNEFPRDDKERNMEKIIEQYPSITHVGKLEQSKLYELIASAEYWMYPSYFNETSCITSMEMLMSEVICLYYPVAGLINTLGDYGIKISEGSEIDSLLDLTMKKKIAMKKSGREYALTCSWENRTIEWCDVLLLRAVDMRSIVEGERLNSLRSDSGSRKKNIKVINLKKREDRKNSMIEQFERENITNYEFIEAVDGNELQESEELRLLFERNNFNYRRGVIGCALSHVQLWNTLINDNDNEYYVILEDDVELFPGFKEKIDSHSKLFQEKQLEHLSLGVYECNELDQEKIKTSEITIFQKDVYKFWNVTFAYIISKNAAKQMISYINNNSIKCAMDNPCSHGEVILYHHTTNCLVKQKNVNLFGTDIQYDYNHLIFPISNIQNPLKIAYCDWWYEEYCGGNFDVNNNFITDILKKYGDVVEIVVVDPTQNPDVLFYSIFGNEHTKYTNVRRIFFSGEPFGIRAEADFNFTFDRNSDKNTRFPLWLGYMNDYLLEECHRRKSGIINVPKRNRFCSFIANGEVKTTHRRTIIEKLSMYKKVDCGGNYLNNIGYNVPRGINCSGKIEHNNNYKFAIAFENEDYPGYVTEKICDIYKSNSIPIYWGTKEVAKDFNPSTFINARDFNNFDELVEYIIKVDNDDDLYASYFKEPMFSNKWLDAFNDPNKTFYKNLADCIICKNKNLFDNYQGITIKKMKVVFSNNCSVGDIYFSQPFIKNIVTNNPEHDYYIYHQTSSYYFTDILEPNIKDVNKLPEFKEELYKIFNFKIDTHKLFNIHNMSSYTYRYDKLNNILLICTWLGVLREKYSDMIECDMVSYNETYKKFITDINKDISSTPESEYSAKVPCFKYNDIISLDLYPCVPTLNIYKYREFQKLNKDVNKDKKIIFYYNVLPSSGQSFPIKNNKEHDLIISILAENNIVVVANKNATISSMKNVYFADDFLENVEYYDAKNFYHHAQMAYESDYSVYYDSGRNFMYMNKTFILENNKNIRLHLSNNDYYFKTLTTNVLIPDNYSNLVMVTNYLDIIDKLKIIIPNMSQTMVTHTPSTMLCMTTEYNQKTSACKQASVFLQIPPENNNQNYNLCIMAIFKNETMNLRMWLEHYLWQGVDHFYLIDNGSTDDPLNILYEYIDKGIVTYYYRAEKHQQVQHYRWVFDNENLKKKTKWLCICDLDEFFFGTSVKLSSVLNDDFDSYDVIYTNSFFYGSDNLIEHPKDIRSFILHREDDVQNGIKYIFKPTSITDSSEIWIHWIVIPDTLQKKQMNEITQNNKIRLNHYRIQSLEYFQNVKMTRGDVSVESNENIRDLKYFKYYTEIATIKDDTLKQLVENDYNTSNNNNDNNDNNDDNNNKNNKNTALIVEPRFLKNLPFVINDFYKKLGQQNWNFVFYCGKGLKNIWIDLLKNEDIEIRELNTNYYKYSEYCDFIKSKELWKNLYGEYVLLFTPSSMIINQKPHTIDFYMGLNKSYIGANQFYQWNELRRENMHPSYNNFQGGLSLRKRLDMIKIIDTFGTSNTCEICSNSQSLLTDAEDVYFTIGCYKLGLPVGDDEICSHFSCHTILKDRYFGANRLEAGYFINLIQRYDNICDNIYLYKNIEDIDNEFLLVHPSTGFFSNNTIRLFEIILYFNAVKKLPIFVDSSKLYDLYKSGTNMNDITGEYFSNNLDLDILYDHSIDFREQYQYIDYSKLNFNDLTPFILKYFSPAENIVNKIKDLENKYKIDNYENICVLFYRGNDKITETPLPSYDDFMIKARTLYNENHNIKFLIQSDEKEFIEIMTQEFPDNSFYFKDEIRTINKTALLSVDKINPHNNFEFSQYYLAITMIMSKCKYILCNTGNCSLWIMLFRGNMDNVYQIIYKKMKIVINSHNKSNIALDHLLQSMKLYEEYNDYEIIVIIGGYYDYNDYEIKKIGNITYIMCNHNSIDFTGLITLVELYSDNINEYYVYLHDTCKIGENFFKKIKSIDLTNVSSIKINKAFSMNIGIYSQKIINEFKHFLLQKKNTNENECMKFKSIDCNEDYIFNNDKNNIILDNYNYLDNYDGWNHTGPTDYYNTGTIRIVEYYSNLDLYKIKANWGQGSWTLNN